MVTSPGTCHCCDGTGRSGYLRSDLGTAVLVLAEPARVLLSGALLVASMKHSPGPRPLSPTASPWLWVVRVSVRRGVGTVPFGFALPCCRCLAVGLSWRRAACPLAGSCLRFSSWALVCSLLASPPVHVLARCRCALLLLV